MVTSPQLDLEEIAKRVKAARALAGFKSTKALAAAIGQRGLKTSTLNLMEQGRRESIPSRDLDAIAAACHLPPEWFYIDIAEAVRATQPAAARLPPLTGELGRRVEGEQPAAQDQRPGASRSEGDARTGTGG